MWSMLYHIMATSSRSARMGQGGIARPGSSPEPSRRRGVGFSPEAPTDSEVV